MTSRASSTTKHNAPYAFVSAFSSGSAIAVIYAIAMLVALPVLNLVSLLSTRNSLANPENESEFTKLSDMYDFQLISEGSMLVPLIIAATIILSVFMGIMMFRFITSKKTVNVYYSLGISRKAMFISRYSAGLIMLFACIVIPFILTAITSAVLIGASAKLFTACLFGIVCVFGLSAFCYSLSAAVFCCVGTSVEGVGFTGIIMLLPSIFFYCLQKFSTLLLYGCPYSEKYVTLANGEMMSNNSLITEFARFNPLTYVNSLLPQYTAGTISEGKVAMYSSYTAGEIWVAPSFTTPLVWLAAAAVAAVIATMMFDRRKAEICGFLGSSNTLNFVASFIVGFGGFTVSVALLHQYGTLLSVLVGCAVLIVVYFALMLSIKRSFKMVIKSSYLLACQLGAALIIYSLFSFGGFGYSSKLPAASEVESIQVSGVSVDSILAENGSNAWEFGDSEEVFDINMSTNLYGDFTTKKDIEQLITLHSKFIELGSVNRDGDNFNNTNVFFRYKLKNGKIIQRFYSRADADALKMCLSIDETDFIKGRIEAIYTASDEELRKEYGSRQDGLRYDTGVAVAVSRTVNKSAFTTLNLTPEQHTALKAALASDLVTQTVEQRYTPAKPAIGAIWFLSKGDIGIFESQGDDAQPSSQDYLSCYNPVSNESSKIIYITPDMAQTIKFLTDNNLLELFGKIEAADIERISFRKAVPNRDSWIFTSGESVSYEVIASNLNSFAGYYYSVDDNQHDNEQNVITDKDKISQIVPLAQMRYYTFCQGYACRIHYTDGSTVEMYISESDAPDFVKYYTYQ